MSASQTTTRFQTVRCWIMITIALITIGFSAPSAVADHMGNHERGPAEACGGEPHGAEDAAPSGQSSVITGRPW